MSTLYIDDADRKRLATKWLSITLWALHVWASVLVIAVLVNRRNAETIGTMFSTVTFGIGATLAILLLDRAADAILAKFAVPTPSAPVTETITRTISPGTPDVKDVNIKAEGDVNVERA
jgi:FtsH-binding integral membrane protein